MDKNVELSIGNDVTMRSSAAGVLGRVDQYELLRELGGGGFGTVYLAKDTVSGVEVAVKGLPPLVRNNKEELENIRANFALVSRLHHPNIAAALILHPARSVSYSDKSVAENLRVFEGDTLMVMEYAPGVTLSQWRKQFPEKKVPIVQAVSITRQIALALDYAHEQKLVHRDIKPSNVMVETRPDGTPIARVLDFGLAAEIRSSMGRVSREIRDTSGTRPYMAPEQWLGGRQGPATDQYSLAVLFHELVTGEVPFASVFETGDPVVMMNVVGREKPTIVPFLPSRAGKALVRALSKTPESRFETCETFVAALTSRDRHSGMNSSNMPSGQHEDAPTIGWRWLLYLVGAILLAVVIGCVIGAWLGGDGESASRRIHLRAGDVKTVTLSNGVGFDMVYCPPGSYMMGSRSDEVGRDDDEFYHRVDIPSGFWIGKEPVGQDLWQTVMGSNPSHFHGEHLPVESVSWFDCLLFLEALNKRTGLKFELPSEELWEYACRAGTTTPYCWGDELNGTQANCNGEIPCGTLEIGPNRRRTTTIGEFGANPWGLLDVHGNVFEWCQNIDDADSSRKDAYRALRGGSYFNAACRARSANRDRDKPSSRCFNYGLRIVCKSMLDVR